MGNQEFDGGMRLMHGARLRSTLTMLTLLVTFSCSTLAVSAQSPNVGLLRVAGIRCPRQVAPGSAFSIELDVEYAVREGSTIRAAIFRISNNASDQLWQSSTMNVTGGGDKIWTIKLVAPPADATIRLSAYAYYLDNGAWRFFNDTLSGPGNLQVFIKVAKNANLEIELGIAGIQFTVGNLTQKTSPTGGAITTLPVGQNYTLSLPQIVDLGNSTRVVFGKWTDGSNQSSRAVLLDGDVNLVASYRTQCLLRVNSILPNYSYAKWYDAGSNVTLQAINTTFMSGQLEFLGLKYNFAGWSGDVNSPSLSISFTLNSPKTINANFSIDYRPLVVPAIFAVGLIGGAILFLLKRKRNTQAVTEEQSKGSGLRCEIEADWTHCVRCGAKLRASEAVDQ
jgi:hypothetical protein